LKKKGGVGGTDRVSQGKTVKDENVGAGPKDPKTVKVHDPRDRKDERRGNETGILKKSGQAEEGKEGGEGRRVWNNAKNGRAEERRGGEGE